MGFLEGFLHGQAAAPAATAQDVDVVEARRRQGASAVLIDVREPDEWQAGHAPGARLIPLGTLSLRLDEVPRDREVLLICRSGNRSGVAQQMLLRQGYASVFNVAGGMLAWTRAGLPVEQ